MQLVQELGGDTPVRQQARCGEMSDLPAARARYVELIAGPRERSPRLACLQPWRRSRAKIFWRRDPGASKSEAARSYRLTPDADPVHLYDNVLVAIDARRKLDTGLPSLWAHFIDLLDVGEKDRVVQIGCGLGYFSAILSEIVGPKGRVQAIECDERLAARAARSTFAPIGMSRLSTATAAATSASRPT